MTRDVRVVDVRWVLGQPGAGRRAYDAGHLPGAIFLDLDGDLALAPGPGSGGPASAARPGRLRRDASRAAGIGSDDLVVAYDDVGGWVAARLWWMLDDLGHRGGEAVLDGGLQAWVGAGGRAHDGGPGPTREHAGLELADHWTNVIERDDLRERLGEVVLLDARGGAALPRRGRADRRLSRATSRRRSTPRPTATSSSRTAGSCRRPSCGPVREPRGRGRRGRRGAARRAGRHLVRERRLGLPRSLAMRLAGLPDPILYVGSYSDWSKAGEPVATGPEPGAPPDR